MLHSVVFSKSAAFYPQDFQDGRLEPVKPNKNVQFFFFGLFSVLCRVYVSMDSYLSMKVDSEAVAQELLQAVADRIDVPQAELLLVAATYPGGEYASN